MSRSKPTKESGGLHDGSLVRRAAIAVLGAVDEGEKVDVALARAAVSGPDRATLQWLVLGTLREYLLLQKLAGLLLRKAWREEDQDLGFLLHLAFYELRHGQRPAFAVVNDWVGMAEHVDKVWAKGLLNAVLRRFLREQSDLEAQIEDANLGHPAWLAARLKAAYPEAWPAIAAANNRPAPLWLRVNPTRVSPEDYGQALQAQGLRSRGVDWSAAALCLPESIPVATLPGWEEGWVAVQDAAAQMAAHILAPDPEERVLDACAAPGGKTAHLWALGARRLDALDRSAERLQKLREALFRQGAIAHLQVADASEPETWWNGEPYDAILLDAPCTGIGVIRRHPDIRLRRQPEDVQTVVVQQKRLLDALWTCLRPGGRLLYATCSILPEENLLQIRAFLERHEDARQQAHPLTGQRLPGQDDMDGFYYALLVKAE